MLKSYLKTVLRILISCITMYIVFDKSGVSFERLIEAAVNYWLVACAMLVFWVAEILSSLRCVYIANQLKRRLSLYDAVRAVYIGMWFNQVFPSSIGGDVIKVGVLKRSLGLKSAIVTAFLSRLGGLFMMMLFFILLYPLYEHYFNKDQMLTDFIIIISTVYIITQFLIVYVSVKFKNLKLGAIGKKFFDPILGYFSIYGNASFLLGQMWTSALVHWGGIFSYVLLALALSLDINIWLVVLVVPVVFLVALIPISFAGWGVREAASVWVFGLVGVDAEKALLLSIGYGVFLVLVALPGLFFIYKNNEKYTDN